jgi:anaerobic ribonucleoside-triphosphate reductase activating protein
MEVYIAGTDDMSMVETDGISYNIYFAGCSIRCPGCQNEGLWDRDESQKTTTEDVFESLIVNIEIADYVCILGGEPTDQWDALIDLLRKIKDIDIPVWLYTGKNMYDLTEEQWAELNKLCYMVKFGPYRPEYPKTSNLATGNQYLQKCHGNKPQGDASYAD